MATGIWKRIGRKCQANNNLNVKTLNESNAFHVRLAGPAQESTCRLVKQSKAKQGVCVHLEPQL